MWLRPLPVANEPNAAVTAGRRTLARVDCRRRGRGFPGHPSTGRGPNGPAACGVRARQPRPLRSRPSLLGRGPSGTCDSDAAGGAGVAAPATPQPAAGAAWRRRERQPRQRRSPGLDSQGSALKCTLYLSVASY